jgi:hypothetical protein
MATVSVSVTVNKRELERLIKRAPTAASATTRKHARMLREDIQRRMPKDTGRTAARTKEVQRGPYAWAVEIPAVPGRFLIEGTRPHVIYPRNRSALRFRGAGGGWVFARMVRHPGTKPHPFAHEAARRAANPLARDAARIFGGR